MKNEVEKYVGQKGWIKLGLLTVDVNITDVKQAYGKTRYQVEPVSGKGSAWVEDVVLYV
jgi:hypothetical protein